MRLQVPKQGTPLLSPQLHDAPADSGRFMVVIFDNDFTPMDEVVQVLIESTGCDVEEAYMEMWEAHHFGKAPVHFASESICHAVANIINTIGVSTEVAKEWLD